MEQINIAIIGCGTVGGGVAKILTEMADELSRRASKKVVLKQILELRPQVAVDRFGLPLSLFCGNKGLLTPEEADQYRKEIINSKDIDLVVETVGGKGDFVHQLCIDILKSGKNLVTANKALLAERGLDIFEVAEGNDTKIGFEAAVCGAIPIIKTIKESFSGDEILSISGIMNGTSNYILSQMQDEKLGFAEALKMAQQNGYAEADPSLDINGGDAGHKLILLIKLAYGIDISKDELNILGIESLTKEDIEFAAEIGAKIKLICYAKEVNDTVYATVRPMMIKNSNVLSGINGATNAVRITNKYSGEHILVGKGAGSSETAMSIVSDIVFIARYGKLMRNATGKSHRILANPKKIVFPYIITFYTGDIPGTTGFIATKIGDQNINIDTVSHNRRSGDKATFSILTMACTQEQIESAITAIKQEKPNLLLSEPKIMPFLY